MPIQMLQWYFSMVLLAQLAYEGESCDLCADKWVIVLANGRSGSTTIIDMLNELHGVYIAGERHVATDLFYFYHHATEHQCGERGPASIRAPVNKTSLLCVVQQAFREAINPEGTECLIGFKMLLASTPERIACSRALTLY